MKSLLFIISTPPYRGSRVAELIDAALVGAVFDCQVSILFRGQGIHCLYPDQDGSSYGQKTINKLLQGLPAYEIDKLFYCQDSAEQYHFDPADAPEGFKPVSPDNIAALIAQQHAVLGSGT